ncbi:hypothetical protein CFBP6411_03304 [Pseudomonas syringae group genomosp. 3]|uniref:Uncharacterized protein n=1 Tax=Pseudomonas syringae group genomosp. 3 TaxID=251701 RepID=A0A2K4WFL1_9PSED|nr:hypothetical protein CFBP6411_03304 [Pseudomonas syringae group genomosp. 3]
MPFWTLCVLFVALRATCWFCESVRFELDSSHLFAPRRLTLRDQSEQSPGSVSGPTSSGSFALSLIRGSLQRAIPGPVQLARHPASHPPDQRQSSAVTYVAPCVVSDIAVKKRFFQLSCDAPRRMPFWTLCVLFVALRALRVSEIRARHGVALRCSIYRYATSHSSFNDSTPISSHTASAR